MVKEVSRFIYNPAYVINGIVGKEAFLPPFKPRPYETSVSFHLHYPVDWGRGRAIGAGRKVPVQLIGSAELDVHDIKIAHMTHDDAGMGPYPAHANIKGWDEFSELARYDQADALAQLASYEAAPEPIPVPKVVNVKAPPLLMKYAQQG